MVYLIMIAAVLILGASSVFATFVYIIIRPHRTKIFFSYSHKDSAIAERIVRRLNMYKFRLYVDFGILIEPDRLEDELGQIISKRHVFVLLASENSVNSRWVQFEINRAQEDKQEDARQWRDMVILALDNDGVDIARRLKLFNDRRMRNFWQYDDSFPDKSVAEKARIHASIKRARSLLEISPYMRRMLIAEIQTFDLRGPFETVMKDVEEYLRNSTRLVRVWSDPTAVLAQRVVLGFILGCLLFYIGIVCFFLLKFLA